LDDLKAFPQNGSKGKPLLLSSILLQPPHQVCGFRKIQQCLTQGFELVEGEGLNLGLEVWGNITNATGEEAKLG
jgi:hypothetical protein